LRTAVKVNVESWPTLQLNGSCSSPFSVAMTTRGAIGPLCRSGSRVTSPAALSFSSRSRHSWFFKRPLYEHYEKGLMIYFYHNPYALYPIDPVIINTKNCEVITAMSIGRKR
jgi:hypothetical protein